MLNKCTIFQQKKKHKFILYSRNRTGNFILDFWKSEKGSDYGIFVKSLLGVKVLWDKNVDKTLRENEYLKSFMIIIFKESDKYATLVQYFQCPQIFDNSISLKKLQTKW